MIITCPRCFSTYRVPDDVLSRGGGRRVRCSSCRFEWTEAPPPREAIAEFSPPPLPPIADQGGEGKSADDAAVEAYLRRRNATGSGSSSATASPPSASGRVSARGKRGTGTLLSVLGWIGFALLSLVVLAGVFRAPLGAMSPRLADLYEDIGLPIDTAYQRFKLEVGAPERREEGGKTVLVLSGRLTNVSRRVRTVPPLRMFWLGHDGKEGPSVTLRADPPTLGVGGIGTFTGELVGVDARAGGEIKVTFDPAIADRPADKPADALPRHAP